MTNLLKWLVVSVLGAFFVSACGGGSTSSTSTDANAKECVSFQFASLAGLPRITNSCPFSVNAVVLTNEATWGPFQMNTGDVVQFDGVTGPGSDEDDPILGFGACQLPTIPTRISRLGTICQRP